MATVDQLILTSPERVFAVLSDGWMYSNWVVGTSHMRAVEAEWPSEGSRLFHASGIWPAVIRDETVVEAVAENERLVLIARGWPAGEARITVELTPAGGHTLVKMTETPIAGPAKWLDNPINERTLKRRNVEALARLAALAEKRISPVERAGPSR